MDESLSREVRRTLRVFKQVGRPIDLQPGASLDNVQSVEEKRGFTFDAALRDFYQYTNGLDHHFFDGSDEIPWFATGDAWALQIHPLSFCSLTEVINTYGLDRDEPWWENNEWGEPDSRIQPLLWHRMWFPIASLPGSAEVWAFDANPRDSGRYGQIIRYVHDPDFVYYVADSFIDFFQSSNDLLEHCLKEDVAVVREWAGCPAM